MNRLGAVRDLEILADPAETVAARAISTRPTFPYSSANTRLNPGARCESLLSRLIAAIRATTIERQGSTLMSHSRPHRRSGGWPGSGHSHGTSAMVTAGSRQFVEQQV